MKRNLRGTYVAVEPFHLDRYIDEQVFRFNNRQNKTDGDRFKKALIADRGKATDLCRAHWQGGRNGLLGSGKDAVRDCIYLKSTLDNRLSRVYYLLFQ